MNNKLLMGLLAVTLALVLGVAWQVSSLATTVRNVADVRVKERQNMTTASWVSGGITITHQDQPKEGETREEFVARFRADVAALKEAFPPDN